VDERERAPTIPVGARFTVAAGIAGKVVGFANSHPESIEVFFVAGTVANPEGITNPPIDELLDKTTSKYALVIFAAKRARQVNAYYSQLGEGLLEYVGPLVETTPQEKPLSIALREINGGLLTAERIEEV
jgi:DNA-directed RNA polymerase subunit omega